MQEPEGSLGREDPLEKATASTPVLLPRQSYGQRGLVGCGPCGCRVGRDRVTERTACVQRELRMFLGCRLRNDFPPRGPALNLLDFTGGARAVPGPAVPRARPGPREAALRTRILRGDDSSLRKRTESLSVSLQAGSFLSVITSLKLYIVLSIVLVSCRRLDFNNRILRAYPRPPKATSIPQTMLPKFSIVPKLTYGFLC